MNISSVIEEIKTPENEGFSRMEMLKSYPEPVSRYLRFHLPDGIPDRNFVEVRLKGIIKLVNWSGFKSTLYANPFKGFVWKATVHMGILPIKGYDYFFESEGAMNWRLFNTFSVMSAKGEDISRSAEGRAKMETVFAPHLLIHPGIKWEVISENLISATWKIRQEDKPLFMKIGNDGSLDEVYMQRWGNPGDTKIFGYHNFGSQIENEKLYKGVVIPQKGNAGWWFNEKAYDDGEFFRFQVY